MLYVIQDTRQIQLSDTEISVANPTASPKHTSLPSTEIQLASLQSVSLKLVAPWWTVGLRLVRCFLTPSVSSSLPAIHEFPTDLFSNKERQHGAVLLHILGVSASHLLVQEPHLFSI